MVRPYRLVLWGAWRRTFLTDESLKSARQREGHISYKELRETTQETMRDLIREMKNSVCSSPVIEQKMTELVQALSTSKGKKQYGYLKKPAKEIVDAIVDELAKQPQVAQCYEEWNRLRDALESYYKDKDDGSRAQAASQGPFPSLFGLSSSTCVSKPSSSAPKITRKFLPVKCEAVSGEQIFSQARKSPQRILCVLSRALTQHEGKSAVRNRLGFGSRRLYQDSSSLRTSRLGSTGSSRMTVRM